MTGFQVMVFVVFLLLGYWIVSAFLNRTPNGKAREPQPESGNWPRVLDIDANASLEEIRAAYQRRMSEYQPDKVASLGAELRELAERKSREITAAYQEALRSRGA